MPPGCNENNYGEAAYIYRYDDRRRCVYKKVPGADSVTYVYDNADRIIYSQDGNQQKRGVYAYYTYDNFNRITSIGECNDTHGSNKTELTRNFYDEYIFIQDPRFNGFTSGSVNAKGLKTGAVISVLGSPSSVQCEVYSYDYRGRLIKTEVKDVYGMKTIYSTSYNLNNQVTKQKEEYIDLGITKTTTNTYDLQGRLTKEHTTVAVSKTTKATAQVEFSYNQVGRLGSKKIGTTSKTDISYLYNTQGQLLSATSTPFTETIYYNTHPDTRAKKYYNGNISAIYWKHNGQSANTTIFVYDKLNRMTSSTNTVKANSLTETGFSYDERGNITGFTRYDASSQPTIYTLLHNAGNHLLSAKTNKSGLYSFNYDANGNQTTAPNGLTITYNSINQPQQVKSGSTVKHKFAYLADGRKLLSLDKIKSNDNIDKDGGLAYIGSSVFIINEGKYDGFESTSFSAGRIVRNSSGTYAVQYHITDHLGSVRAVLNQSMTVLEQNDYYPFGLRHPNASLKTTANRYRYNGKEEITSTNTSDYDARQYSAEFCQWMQADPLAEKYYSWSPYNFCVGNPLRFVDPNGMGWITATYNGETFYFFDSEVNSQQDIINRYYNGDDRDSYDISYLGDSYSFANEDNQYNLNGDGTYSLNGTLCDSEIDNGGLHIGNDTKTRAPYDEDKFSKRNLYGVYLGPNNPRNNDKNNTNVYSYTVPPIDQLDYAAYNHDRGYDKKGAAGAIGAFANVSTLPEDLKLVLDCQQVISGSKSISNYELSWAKQTKILFLNISIGKIRLSQNPLIQLISQ